MARNNKQVKHVIASTILYVKTKYVNAVTINHVLMNGRNQRNNILSGVNLYVIFYGFLDRLSVLKQFKTINRTRI